MLDKRAYFQGKEYVFRLASPPRASPLPVVLSFRRGGEADRAFWRRTLEAGQIEDGDLQQAVATMRKHRPDFLLH